MTQRRIAEVQEREHPACRTSVPGPQKRRDHRVTRSHRLVCHGDNDAVSARAACAAEIPPAAREHSIADMG